MGDTLERVCVLSGDANSVVTATVYEQLPQVDEHAGLAHGGKALLA
jgi:hypothetical protein